MKTVEGTISIENYEIACRLLFKANEIFAYAPRPFADSSPGERHIDQAHRDLASRLTAMAQRVLDIGYEEVYREFRRFAPDSTISGILKVWPQYTESEATQIQTYHTRDFPIFKSAVWQATQVALAEPPLLTQPVVK